MSCCTKDKTSEKNKDKELNKKSCCDSMSAPTEETSHMEHSAEDCTDQSCHTHHKKSPQSTDQSGCCDKD